MANKMSIISEVEMETVNELLKNATDEQRNSIMRFGAQMYHDGWSDNCGKFFLAGVFVGVVVAITPIVEEKLRNRKKADNQ
ncbi:MAG: hypothetical protein IJ087_17885 [Eggerthellaceae bacterium]|nr:hypothetical protein [Eggerthellaceae bacterium]